MSPSDSLMLGTDPGDLTVKIIRDRAWEGVGVLYELLPDQTEQVIPWDYPPSLEFENGLVIASVLSEDDESHTADSVATWEMTEAQVASLVTGMTAQVTVNDEVWFMGDVRCRS